MAVLIWDRPIVIQMDRIISSKRYYFINLDLRFMGTDVCNIYTLFGLPRVRIYDL